jgi:hypothetical protein
MVVNGIRHLKWCQTKEEAIAQRKGMEEEYLEV